MKRILCALLALVMLVALCSCGQSAVPAAGEDASRSLSGLFNRGGEDAGPADTVAGVYRLTAINAENAEDSATLEDLELMESLGLTIRLTVNEDGTGVLDMYGEAMDFTWDDARFTIEGEVAEYTYENDTLTLVEGAESLVFVKVVEETPAGEPAEAPAEEPAGESAVEEPLVEEPAEEPAEERAGAQPLASGDFGENGEYHVDILAAEYFADSDGKDAVRFYYDFTNNSALPTSAWWPLSFAAEEDGYELVSAYAAYSDDVPEYGNRSLHVLPGVTIRCIEEYSFRPDGSELTFTVSRYDSEDLAVQFDPKALPGRPGDWSIAPIPEPQYYLDQPAEGSTDSAQIAITGAEIVPQDSWYGDGNVLRVFFDYTNKSDEESYITSDITVIAYQDGVELSDGYAEDALDSDGIWYDEVPAGESRSLSRCWALRSDSPVELAVTDWWSDAVLCAGTFYPEG